MVKARVVESAVVGVRCDLVNCRRLATFLLNMKMLREWGQEGDEGDTSGYLCCVSIYPICLARQLKAAGAGKSSFSSSKR